MKLHVACSILFIGFSGCTLANQLTVGEITDNTTPHSRGMTAPSPQPPSVLSVFLYLPLIDDAAWSNIMAQSQLTVTPTATYTVRAIKVTSWNSQNGSCTSLYGTENIDNGAGNTVTLTNGHNYHTTDASNWALNQLVTSPVGIFSTSFDTTFQLLDNSLSNIGSSVCIAGTALAPATSCNNATNCGWNSARTWTP